MLKWLVLAVVVVGALWWIRQSALRRRGDGRAGGAASPSTRKGASPEAMIACAHCGAWVPESESVAGDGQQRFCSIEHRRAGPR